MSTCDKLLKTRQVAHAFGVSVSTVKRWVDTGGLCATRTLGKHRLIPLGEALRFAREKGIPHVGLESWERGAGTGIAEIDDHVRDDLFVHLRDGRSQRAHDLVVSTYQAVPCAVTLADCLIRPVMERLGHGWQSGVIDVFQEHHASHIIKSALLDLIQRTPGVSGETAPLAMGASPEGDLYTLCGILCELLFVQMRWRVMNLSCNLPLDSLGRAVNHAHPQLIWLSVNHLENSAQFVGSYRSFYESISGTGAAVIVGGRAMTAELRSQILFAGHGDRLAHLAEYARRIQAIRAGQLPSVRPQLDSHSVDTPTN